MAKKKTSPRPTLDYIRKYKEQLVGSTDDGSGGYYAGLRREQIEDQRFYDDKFDTSIKAPYHIIRLGTAARIVDAVTWNINTSNPQAFRKERNSNATEKERTAKVNRLLNHWLMLLVEEIEEAIKNGAQRGESFFQVDYNPNFAPSDSNSLPVLITAPDPMIIYPDPHEHGGIPREAVKCCRMSANQVKKMYPKWSNPKRRKLNDREGVKYFAWWNDDWRYFEADEEALLKGADGIQENILGKVPISHAYSGFGKKSPQGKPEAKAVGILRNLRGRLVEECEVESRIDSIIGLFANPVIDVWSTDPQKEISVEEARNISYAPGTVNIYPTGTDHKITQGDVPQPQMFQHLYQIKQALGVELPPVAFGLPSTSRATGRQEDIYSEHYRKKFSKLITNDERSLATALGMGLKLLVEGGKLPITVRATVIEDGKPTRKEETITKDDIDGYYDCTVELKAPNELEQDKKVMLYRILANEGRVAWKTLLTKGLGLTEDQAEDEINEALAERAWLTNPMLLEMVMEEAMEDAGMGRLLAKVKERAARAQVAQQGLTPAPPGQVRPSEARNPMAKDIMRKMLSETPVGIRQSPQMPQGGGM